MSNFWAHPGGGSGGPRGLSGSSSSTGREYVVLIGYPAEHCSHTQTRGKRHALLQWLSTTQTARSAVGAALLSPVALYNGLCQGYIHETIFFFSDPHTFFFFATVFFFFAISCPAYYGGSQFNPFRTPVPFWGHTTQIPSSLSSIVPKTRLRP